MCLPEGTEQLWDRSGPAPAPPSNIIHQTRLTMSNFVFHKVLGKGSFGKVGSTPAVHSQPDCPVAGVKILGVDFEIV